MKEEKAIDRIWKKTKGFKRSKRIKTESAENTKLQLQVAKLKENEKIVEAVVESEEGILVICEDAKEE